MTAIKIDKSDSNEFCQYAIARSNVYKFFARLFLKEPSKEIIANIQNKNFLRYLQKIFGDDPTNHFKNFIENFDGNFETLKTEYTSLFVAPVKSKYVSPYESVYKTGLTHQKPMVEVKRIYEQIGLELSDDCKELPDHLGLELEFMGFLCECESEAWKNKDTSEVIKYSELQKEFLSCHISGWVQELCDEILKNTNSDFYKGVANFLKEYIIYDQDLVNEIKQAAG